MHERKLRARERKTAMKAQLTAHNTMRLVNGYGDQQMVGSKDNVGTT
jgi:hypothetical protein